MTEETANELIAGATWLEIEWLNSNIRRGAIHFEKAVTADLAILRKNVKEAIKTILVPDADVEGPDKFTCQYFSRLIKEVGPL